MTVSQGITTDRHGPLSLEGQATLFMISGLVVPLLHIYAVEMSADIHYKRVQEHP